MKHFSILTVLLLWCCETAHTHTGLKPPISVDDIVGVKSVSEVRISPNGEYVAYIVRTPHLESNAYTQDLFVAAADGKTPPRRLTYEQEREGENISAERMSPIWTPSSLELAFVTRRGEQTEIRLVDVTTGQQSTLLSSAEIDSAADLGANALHSASSKNMSFSPSGDRLAFLAHEPAPSWSSNAVMTGINAHEDWYPSQADEANWIPPVARLYVLDTKSSVVQAVTGTDTHVMGFQWSPKGDQFVLEASSSLSSYTRYMENDIFVVDSKGGEIKPLATLPGADSDPVWSSDGKKIAFCSQNGSESWLGLCDLTVVAADGDSPPMVIGAQIRQETGSKLRVHGWSPNDDNIYVSSLFQMGRHLFRVSATDGSYSRVTVNSNQHIGIPSFSQSAESVALTIEGVSTPQEVFVSQTEEFLPVQLTDINQSIDQLSTPSVETINWPSRDGKWTIHGLLIKPSFYDPDKRYPMLTHVTGGPNMTVQMFNNGAIYPLLALAERGYIVFSPNSRGRGGYGEEFHYAIRDEQSYVHNPLSDVLEGIDLLVAEGVADADRLGIAGFSYGGTLTAYAVTTTDRFRAAIYGEGSPNLLLSLDAYAKKEVLGLSRDLLGGLHKPFEPATFKRAFEQSSIYRVHCVNTPVLLESGALANWKTDRPLFRGLQYYGVPSEWFVYPRSYHGWDEPVLLLDAFNRHIDWFNYWINDEPVTDGAWLERYDEWKSRKVPREESDIPCG